MSPAFLFAVYALAVARVAVLITEDRITDRPREALLARLRARAVAREVARVERNLDLAVGQRLSETERDDLGAIYARDMDDPYLAYLLTCQWCVSVWLAFAAAPLWFWQGDSPWLLVPAAALAFSFITGKLSQFGG